MKKESINSINGLRGIACLMIVLYHTRLGVDIPLIGGIVKNGFMFVEVFLVISGFVMAYNYGDRIGQQNFKTYISRRYFKLMPLFWTSELVLFLYAIVQNIVGGRYIIPKSYFAFIFEQTGFCGWSQTIGRPWNDPLWTISCLLWCYALYYVVAKLSQGSKNAEFTAYILLLVVSCVLIIKPMDNGIVFLEPYFLRCVAAFSMGVLICAGYGVFEEKKVKTVVGRLLVIAGISVYFLGMDFEKLYDAKEQAIVFGILVLGPVLLLMALYISIVKKTLELKLFQWLGEIALSLYVWHAVVIIVFEDMMGMTGEIDQIVRLVEIGISVVVAIISKIVLEGLVLKKKTA